MQMPDTEDEVRFRVRCRPETYKAFKIAAIEADMTVFDAVDVAFKMFAQAIRDDLAEKANDKESSE